MPEPKQNDPLKAVSDFYNKLAKREKMLFYAASFCITLLLLDALILSPIMNRITAIELETAQEISLIKDGLMIIGYKDPIQKEYDALKQLFTDIRKTQEEELAEFLKDMENLAMQSGIRLTTVTPAATNDAVATLFTVYEIKLECDGSMEQLLEFIYDVSVFGTPTKIQNVEFIPPAKGEGGTKCTMVISRLIVSA